MDFVIYHAFKLRPSAACGSMVAMQLLVSLPVDYYWPLPLRSSRRVLRLHPCSDVVQIEVRNCCYYLLLSFVTACYQLSICE